MSGSHCVDRQQILYVERHITHLALDSLFVRDTYLTQDIWTPPAR